MAELYGIKSAVKPSISQAPVSLGTELVFIGTTASNEKRFNPVRCTSRNDLMDAYGSDAITEGCSFHDIATYAFETLHLDHAWFINLGGLDLDEDDVSADDVKAAVDSISESYAKHQVVPNIVVLAYNNLHQTPNITANYAASVCLDIADHFKAQVLYDQTVASTDIEAITRSGIQTGQYRFKASAWASKEKNSSTGNSIACVGELILARYDDGTIATSIPMSVVAGCLRALQDSQNIAGIPYRSVGNLNCVGGVGYAVRTPGNSPVEVENTESINNTVTEQGFLIAKNKGGQRYCTWGDHTASFKVTVDDELYRFDSNVAMAYHLANRWILKWGNVIDNPMTLSLRNDIINEEQSYLDYLVSIGALVGNPKCEFRATDNTSDTLGQGQFYFTDTYTSAIPAKYLQMNLVWTSEGLNSYLED